MCASGRPQHHRPRANTWQWRGAVGWGRAFCGSRRVVKVSPGEPGATVYGVRSGPRRAPSGVLKCHWITKPCPRRTSHGCARLAACLSFCGRALRVRSTSAKAAQHGNKPMDRQCTVLCGHSSPAINSLAAWPPVSPKQKEEASCGYLPASALLWFFSRQFTMWLRGSPRRKEKKGGFSWSAVWRWALSKKHMRDMLPLLHQVQMKHVVGAAAHVDRPENPAE